MKQITSTNQLLSLKTIQFFLML